VIRASAVIATLAVAALASQAPDLRIVTDGDVREWKAVPVGFRDPQARATALVRLVEVRTLADARFLHALLTFDREINPLGSLRTFSLAVDADGDATTDVTIDLGGDEEGALVRRPGQAPGEMATADALGFLMAPVHAATQFEIRLDRRRLSAATGTAASATSARLRMGFAPAGAAKATTADVVVSWPVLADPDRPAPDDRSPTDDPLGRAPSADFRVVAWNVNGIPAAQRDAFAAVFRALDPDLILFAQVPPLEARGLEGWLPVVAGRPAWRVVSPALAVRGEGLVVFTGLPYPPAAADAIAKLFFPDDPKQRDIRRAVIENGTIGSGVLTVLGGRRLLSVPLHLYPGGADPDGPRDLYRVTQANVIRSAVQRSLKSGSAQAVILGGDLNVVGTRKPLDLLQRDLDLDGSPLALVDALQLNGRSNATWIALDPINARFPPGRLDSLLFSDSSLELLKSFVFDARDLAPPWQARHALESVAAGDRRLSDHMPRVADFKWR
jgi:hypothetical protein